MSGARRVGELPDRALDRWQELLRAPVLDGLGDRGVLPIPAHRPAGAAHAPVSVPRCPEPWSRPGAAVGEDAAALELEGAERACVARERRAGRVERVAAHGNGVGTGEEARLVEVVDRNVEEE